MLEKFFNSLFSYGKTQSEADKDPQSQLKADATITATVERGVSVLASNVPILCSFPMKETDHSVSIGA